DFSIRENSETHRLNLELQVIFLLHQSYHLFFQLFSFGLRLCKVFFSFFKFFLHVGHLLLGLCALQERFDLEIQLHPGPVFHIHEGADVVLDAEDGLSVIRTEMFKVGF
ncbi:mCG144602, partial [Mus musculus]